MINGDSHDLFVGLGSFWMPYLDAKLWDRSKELALRLTYWNNEWADPRVFWQLLCRIFHTKALQPNSFIKEALKESSMINLRIIIKEPTHLFEHVNRILLGRSLDGGRKPVLFFDPSCMEMTWKKGLFPYVDEQWRNSPHYYSYKYKYGGMNVDKLHKWIKNSASVMTNLLRYRSKFMTQQWLINHYEMSRMINDVCNH